MNDLPPPPEPPKRFKAIVFGATRGTIHVTDIVAYTAQDGCWFLTTASGEVHGFRISESGMVLRPQTAS